MTPLQRPGGLLCIQPCFLMGGTLPAATKFVQRDDDHRRSITAFFYGINIAGSVAGAVLSTFWLLLAFGGNGTLTIAVLANLSIAVAAGAISMFQEKESRHTSLSWAIRSMRF